MKRVALIAIGTCFLLGCGGAKDVVDRQFAGMENAQNARQGGVVSPADAARAGGVSPATASQNNSMPSDDGSGDLAADRLAMMSSSGSDSTEIMTDGGYEVDPNDVGTNTGYSQPDEGPIEVAGDTEEGLAESFSDGGKDSKSGEKGGDNTPETYDPGDLTEGYIDGMSGKKKSKSGDKENGQAGDLGEPDLGYDPAGVTGSVSGGQGREPRMSALRRRNQRLREERDKKEATRGPGLARRVGGSRNREADPDSSQAKKEQGSKERAPDDQAKERAKRVTSDGETDQKPSVEILLHNGVSVPQLTSSGTGMSFSVDYQVRRGGPQKGFSYYWAITNGQGQTLAQPIKMQGTGTLRIVIPQFRPDSGPFKTTIWAENQSKTRFPVSKSFTFPRRTP